MSKFRLFNDDHFKEKRTRKIEAPFSANDILLPMAGINNVKFYVLTNGECRKHPNGCPVTSIGLARSQPGLISKLNGLTVYFHGPQRDDFTMKSLRELKPENKNMNVNFLQTKIGYICSGAPNPYHQGWEIENVDITCAKKCWKVVFSPGRKL